MSSTFVASVAVRAADALTPSSAAFLGVESPSAQEARQRPSAKAERDVLLVACAAARQAKDLEACLASAQAALRTDAACGKAWVFLCWALFELRRYDEACAQTRRAVTHRSWSLRDREGMAALCTSCQLLSRLSPAQGTLLRDEWYRKRLHELCESGALFEYEVDPTGRSRRRKGVGRDELSLLVNVPANGLRGETLGGDGGERDVPSGLLEDSGSAPVEQALGGVIYLKSHILRFHCDRRSGARADDDYNRRRRCYDGDGPCFRCVRIGFPEPAFRFPSWSPALTLGATLHIPHPEMDVLFSTNAVPPELHAQLSAALGALATKRGRSPMPQYLNIIDPNLNAADHLWVPTEFEVSELPLASLDVVCVVELACLAATGGKRLPFGFGTHIARLAADGQTRAEASLRSAIGDLDPHAHAKLHVATQKLMAASLPLLARLRRPALLLPGPLQVVVKAQRISLADGEDYAGVWHEDGMREHVLAVVLYYYRASPVLVGGSLEFCSKQREALWSGDAGGELGTLEKTAELAAALPRCQVPVAEGMLVCFSNYAAVHRVLRMEARGGGGSRDFMAFFVIDQRHPLPTPTLLPPLDERLEAARALLQQQLQPRGTFGLDSRSVYSTGNGSVADVGWMEHGGDGGGQVAEDYPASASLIERLNMAPPLVERGASMILNAPPTPEGELVAYNPSSGWVEVWIGEGARASVLYLDLNWGEGISVEPPVDGVSEVRSFPRGIAQFAAFVEEHGYWTQDELVQARLEGTAIELVVQGKSYFLLWEQLRCMRRLRSLAEGSRCELEPFLEAPHDQVDDGTEEQSLAAGTEHELPFQPSAWPHVYEYIQRPDQPFALLEDFMSMHSYQRQRRWRSVETSFLELQASARVLGFGALFTAAGVACGKVRAAALQ